MQSEFVTTSDVAAAAKFTDPLALSIVCAPVVPPAVMVFVKTKLPALVNPKILAFALDMISRTSVGTGQLARVPLLNWAETAKNAMRPALKAFAVVKIVFPLCDPT